MVSASFSVFFLLSHLVLLHSAEEEKKNAPHPGCSPFTCGKLGLITFPFKDTKHPDCGEFMVNCSRNRQFQTIQLKKGGQWYDVTNITPPPPTKLKPEVTVAGYLKIHDPMLKKQLQFHNCDILNSFTSPNSPYSFSFLPNRNLFKCFSNPGSKQSPDVFFHGFSSYKDCEGYSIYYNSSNNRSIPSRPLPHNCSPIDLPKPLIQNSHDLFTLSTDEFLLLYHVYVDYHECLSKGGQCEHDSWGNFRCSTMKKGKKKLPLILGIVIPGTAGILIICLLIFFCRKKWKSASSNLVSRNISYVPSSKSDLERGSVYFGVLPIFSYSELEEATNNFDPTKELGDGGFGTVYYGKLRDGREVAVKRLYFKQVEQFMNEVQILAVLRHKNLVTLYGCTSRHSRELLLVYEFIPNGTVADHLHGNQPKPGSLTWPIRMSIAIETATALAYLHASDIIHRDVKTNNILLDNNFGVKVADFGLSRLFPINVTHVSTAPQGTPGYLDPEYHHCYQLTDKSDVYSFGVVLIELISSLPAVDISRHRHEINLADLAISKIQNCAFSELIDSSLGSESDLMVRRMTTKVAELAFRCLQQDKDMRPSMHEVCDVLKEIESEEYEVKKTEEVENIDVGVLEKSTRSVPSPDSDDIGLLKNVQLPPHSPTTVTEQWVSRSSTPNTSA